MGISLDPSSSAKSVHLFMKVENGLGTYSHSQKVFALTYRGNLVRGNQLHPILEILAGIPHTWGWHREFMIIVPTLHKTIFSAPYGHFAEGIQCCGHRCERRVSKDGPSVNNLKRPCTKTKFAGKKQNRIYVR
jgi:hypothetical protein